MAEQDSRREDEILAELQSVKSRLSRLTVAVMLMILAVLLSTMAQYGALANYFGGDPMIWGLIGAGSAIAGFVLGWIAGRRA